MDESQNAEGGIGFPTRSKANASEHLHSLLQGHQEALSKSVTDPICVPSPWPDDPRFGKQYYDTTEDENEGRIIVQGRITEHGNILKAFINQHKRMLNLMETIEEAANHKHTERVIQYCKRYQRVYAAHIEFIKDFKEKENTTNPISNFLDYPSAEKTTLTKGHIIPSAVNPQRDYKNAIATAENLELILHHIDSSRPVDFSVINVDGSQYYGIDVGEDFIKSGADTSYRGRIEFTINMLEREGFKL